MSLLVYICVLAQTCMEGCLYLGGTSRVSECPCVCVTPQNLI